MSNSAHAYHTGKEIKHNGMHFIFLSKGKTNIIKSIRYTYVQEYLGKALYNLGFGDYDITTGAISDDLVSNNGDQYKVFNTVLNSIPAFFNHYPSAVLIVRGSDSLSNFIEKCRKKCTNKCVGNQCQKAHRRIGIYRQYVDSNYNVLTNEYQFFGGFVAGNNQIITEKYQVGLAYTAVLLTKKSNFI